MKSKFSVGQVWETDGKGPQGAIRFTIIGPPEYANHSPKTWKRCRCEHVDPYWNERHPAFEQDYSHTHLKRYAKLVEEK